MLVVTERYKRAFKHTLSNEGGYSNDPSDPGGETQYGISRRYWPQYWKNGPPTLNAAYEFYHSRFWSKMRGDEIMDERVAVEIFDTAVNIGIDRAVKIVQNCAIVVGGARIADDGDFGPVTLRAVNSCCTINRVETFLHYLNGAQLGYYIEKWHDNPRLRKYVNGWRNRCKAS